MWSENILSNIWQWTPGSVARNEDRDLSNRGPLEIIILNEKTLWNNSNTVLWIQPRGRVVTKFKKPAKSLLIALQLMSISQVISTFLKSQKKSFSRRTSKESFWPIRIRPENIETIFLLISKVLNNFFPFFLSIL